MVRCDRFTIEQVVIDKKEERVVSYHRNVTLCMEVTLSATIYDRVEKKDIVEIKTNDSDLNKEIAEQVVTMLNIKYMGE